jgi:cell division protein FtsI (penicillin-binding protein 3)
VIKHPDDPSWSKTTLPYMSIGYECQLTPLQILAFYNAVANGGVLVKPLFVQAVQDKGTVRETFGPQVVDSAICSAETVRKAQALLEGVVQRGTATSLKHSQYGIAGKTGTARVASVGKGYTEVKYQASFVGYFPADRPAYSCMVVVYAPSNDVFYAAQVAAPVFKDISDKIYATHPELHPGGFEAPAGPAAFPQAKKGRAEPARRVYAGLRLDSARIGADWQWMTMDASGKAREHTVATKRGTVPDVTGMGLRDALLLLENAGFQVTVQGRGAVKNQSPAPGSAALPGGHVVIELG